MPKKNINIIKILKSASLSTTMACVFFSAGLTASPNMETLSGVKTEISLQERLLSTRNKKLTELQSELERQEQVISKLVSDIREVDQTLKEMNANIEKVEINNRQLEQQKETQIKELKALLDSQYRQGKHGSLNAVLSGKGADLDRMTVYAEHLSKARSKIINELEATSTTLQLQRHDLDKQREQKISMLAKLNTDKETLEETQRAQQETSKKVQQQIKNNENYLAELKENERRLLVALKEAQEAQAKREEEERRLAKLQAEQVIIDKQQAQEVVPVISMAGIAAAKGKLNWPVKGKLLHSFGSQQSGQVRWHGVVISAKAGTEVEAIHDGTVVLSNWLRGYGLMLVIDHGKGDMSVYGYNQTLLRQVGDKVKAGETIALVGNSGGQTSTGLYFEIRRKGQAINPTPWLQR